MNNFESKTAAVVVFNLGDGKVIVRKYNNRDMLKSDLKFFNGKGFIVEGAFSTFQELDLYYQCICDMFGLLKCNITAAQADWAMGIQMQYEKPLKILF